MTRRALVRLGASAMCAGRADGLAFEPRPAQRSSWMRIRLPAGSRKAQSRIP